MKLRSLLLTPLAAASVATAQTDSLPAPGAERPLTFELGTGLEYDSNVAVLDLDTSADAGDVAAQLDFGLGYDSPRDGPFDWQAGYDFSQSLHEDFDAFDVRIHRGSATTSYDLGRVDTGATFQYARAELDGAEFLTLAQISPYLSKLIGKRLFLRFAYAHSDKEFAGNPQRDAAADALAADAYVFLNGLSTYLVLGYRHDDEDALDPQFDYAADKLSAQLSQRIAARVRELTFKAQLRYETRDYASPTLSIGAPRRDDRLQLEATLDVPFRDRLVARIGYRHADNRSNLPAVDFDENVLSVGLTAEF